MLGFWVCHGRGWGVFANDLVSGYGKTRRKGKLWMTSGLPAPGGGGMGWPLLLQCRDSVDRGQEPCVGHGESELTVGHPLSHECRGVREEPGLET